MKKLPLGIQSFRNIVEGDYIYVDKTLYVFKLLNEAKFYFLSRPRRFGKSLLLDTIAEAVGGGKDIHQATFAFLGRGMIEMRTGFRFVMSKVFQIL